MTDDEEQDIGQLFGGLAADRHIKGYIKLHQDGPVAKDEAAEFLGDPELVRELTDLGLAHPAPHTPTAPATFHAVTPDLALLALIGAHLASAEREHGLLLAGYRRLSQIPRRLSGDGDGQPSHQIRIITDTEKIMRLSLDLINGVQKNWMTLETLDSDMPLTEDFVVAPPPVLRGRVRARAIYDRASIDHPVAWINMQRSIAAGEEARWVPTVPVKLQLADDFAAILALTTTGTRAAAYITAVPVLRLFRDYYEMKWQIATPVGSTSPPPGCPLKEGELEVLRLLSQGALDKHIREQLNISDSTVTRRVEAIKAALHVTNRFAAGAAAQRHGWLDAPGGRNG